MNLSNINSDQTDKSSRIIVSFTSFPARINLVPQVLDSLYAQSKKADMILLWLAKEQFPSREAELPSRLTEDAASGKIELRWCDDLGSHKKYFYAMQEFPDDIIITVDDDIVYHPDTIKTLWEFHCQYPKTVTCLTAKLILFDDNNKLCRYADWLYDIILPVPSMQIIPMGGGGVLYPPHCLDSGVFDKETITNKLKYNGIICDDDIWLKIHSILADTPSITQDKYKIAHQTISTPQSIGDLDKTDQLHHHLMYDEFLSLRSEDGGHTVQDIFFKARRNGDYYDFSSSIVRKRTYEFVLERLNSKINKGESISVGFLHYYLSFFTWAMTFSDTDTTQQYIHELKTTLLRIHNIDEISRKSKHIDAVLEYNSIVLEELTARNRQSKVYYQMLSNWNNLFKLFPAEGIPKKYLFSYMRFLTNMSVFSRKMNPKVYSLDQIKAFKKDIKKARRQLPLVNRIRLTAMILKRYS